MPEEIVYGIENLLYYRHRFCRDMSKAIENENTICFHKFYKIVEELLWLHSQIWYALLSRGDEEIDRLEDSINKLHDCVSTVINNGILVYGEPVDVD